MSTVSRLQDELRKHVDPGDAVVFVHAALANFLDPTLDPEECVDTLLGLMGEEQTLAMATFTLGFTKTGRFDVRQTPSEMGDLSNAFLRRPGVMRSRHPIYSVAAYGPRAEEIVAAWGTTCFGQGSIFEYLEKVDARVLMFGATMKDHCTLHHRAEELARVPYRFFKSFAGVVLEDGESVDDVEVEFFVRRMDLPTAYDFRDAVERLRSSPSYLITQFRRGTIESANAREILRTAGEGLDADPYSALLEGSRARAEIEARPLRVLGSTNLAWLEADLRVELAHRQLDGYRVPETPFGQYAQLALAEESQLYEEPPGEVLLLVRAEELIGPYLQDRWASGSPIEWDEIEQRIRDYAHLIGVLRDRYQGAVAVADFALTLHPPDASADHRNRISLDRIEHRCNEILEKEVFTRHPDVARFPYRRHLRQFGMRAARPGKYWYLGRFPFSRAFNRDLARGIVDSFLVQAGRVARAVVCDLDNTLWGGVLGEVGSGGIAIGGDHPGNVHRDIQMFLKGLKQRGIALAICSKNDETLALRTLEDHPAMVLRPSDFAAHSINWEDKAGNIRAIADDLNLGLDTLVFLDDQPAERELIRRFLPEVIVPELPSDPAEWLDLLREQYFLDVERLTDEDRLRSETMRTAVAIKRKRHDAVDMASFLRSLNMSVAFEELSDGNRERLAQLFKKTNQFNATTRRHTPRQIEELDLSGNVYGVRIEGNVDPSEVAGALVLCPGTEGGQDTVEIESLLFSCRMAGRGLERAMIAFAADQARAIGARYLIGEIRPTERNGPIRDIYRDGGFQETTPGRWGLDLQEDDIPMPDWFRVIS